MRRVALLVLVVACGAASAVAALARPADKVLSLSTCGKATHYTFLFWPHGHPAIASVGFPAFPIAHLEAYRGVGPTYPDGHFVASVVANGVGAPRAGCVAVLPIAGIVYHGKSSTTSTTALVCTFPKAPIHKFVRLSSGGSGYAVINPPKLRVVYAQLKLAGSKLSYDASFCHRTPPPK